MVGESAEVSLLLVEDSPADVYLVEEAMRCAGLKFQMQVVEDGESAIRKIDSNRCWERRARSHGDAA